MKLIWHGHSCFLAETALGTAVFDPYTDGKVPGLAPLSLTADAVYCSHGHDDHSAADKVTLTGRKPGFRVETIPCFHDDMRGLKRGRNTIHVLEAEGLRVAHLGDLGHRLKGPALEKLRGVDALLIPVGGFFTIDAAAARAVADDIGPRVVIPMHYRLGDMGFAQIAELSAFTDLCADVIYYDTNTLKLTAETPAQTAVLRYCHE